MSKVYVIYPGRFQPMGKHHVKVYDALRETFNTGSVYIATTDKTNLLDSPFTALEKKVIMESMGIPPSKILTILNKSPYDIDEAVRQIEIGTGKKLDENNDILIYACGEKDAQRFTSFTKKDGTPSRFQPYIEGKVLPFKHYAYIYIIPTVKIPLGEEKEMSGTLLREHLSRCNVKEFRDVMGFYDFDIHEKLKHFNNVRKK